MSYTLRHAIGKDTAGSLTIIDNGEMPTFPNLKPSIFKEIHASFGSKVKNKTITYLIKIDPSTNEVLQIWVDMLVSLYLGDLVNLFLN